MAQGHCPGKGVVVASLTNQGFVNFNQANPLILELSPANDK